MRISIIGTGMIATEVITVLRNEAKGMEITSIFSHSNREKAEELALTNMIPRVYTDYGQLLREDKADFLYIALVNSAHYAFVRQALEANRNVIVEKPFTADAAQAEELAALARERKLYLFEAISPLHTPNFRLVKDSLERIGPVHFVQCNFSQYSSRYERYLRHDVAPAFNPALGGGALADLNVYNISVVIGLFGRPQEAQYFANRGHNGVDTSGVMVLSYPGLTATCTATKDSSSPSFVIVQGEKGWIRIPTPANFFSSVEIMAQGKLTSCQRNAYENRLTHEFMDFKDVWERQDYACMEEWLNTSIDVMWVMEKGK
ncbi:MAG: Gfo/Idh/MocA family oxidoreductase [Prevotella sp.]|nr:Gfo/Idh/MocA family oxidoreductase [Prevotella sp.]